MDAMGRLAACAADAVGRNPKEGWQDSLICACDDVEEVYDELLAALHTCLEIVEFEHANDSCPEDLPSWAEAIAAAKTAITQATEGGAK
jgi:hypothetical protein